MGVITPVALRTYPEGFPEEVLADAFTVDEPDMISLAQGWPSPQTYPVDELARRFPKSSRSTLKTRLVSTSR